MNKIFKTIWNRARRSYVAVNETVCGAAQADGKTGGGTTVSAHSASGKLFVMSAVALAVMNVYAETITDSTTVNSNLQYSDLSISGEATGGSFSIETGTFKWAKENGIVGWDSFSKTGFVHHSKHSQLDAINENEIKEFSSWFQSKFGRKPSIYVSEAWDNGKRAYSYINQNDMLLGFEFFLQNDPESLDKETLAEQFGKLNIANNGQLSVSGSLTLGTINVDSELEMHYVKYYVLHQGLTNSDNYSVDYLDRTNSGNGVIDLNATVENNGGKVNIGELVLENPENTYTQNDGETDIDKVTGDGSVIINDGTLSTNAGVLIDIAEAKAAQIEAKELFAPTTAITVSSLAAGEKSHVSGISATGDQFTINGGTLNIKGTYEQSIADQAETLLKDYYGQNINVTFDEVVADQTLDLTNGYTTAVLKSIYDENGRSDVLFHTLNWNAQGTDLMIGFGDMAESIGVKNIDNARQVTVTNGKTFAILGEGAGSSVNGTFVADNGNLVFGAEGLTSGGTVNSVTMRNNASVTVANGVFDMTSVIGNGNFTVAQNATANFDNHTIDGSFSNAGNLNVDGALTFADGSTFTSSGNLTTNQDNVFQNVTPSVIDPLKVIGVAAQMPEEVQTVAAELFRKYVPGEVADALAEHASFTGGKVVVTGVNLTETQVADLTQAFKEKLFSPDRSLDSNVFPAVLA